MEYISIEFEVMLTFEGGNAYKPRIKANAYGLTAPQMLKLSEAEREFVDQVLSVLSEYEPKSKPVAEKDLAAGLKPKPKTSTARGTRKKGISK